ncbi:MAG TPA: methylenetetrahydrofolate reductase [Alphaproteobacteria bacterium]|nr:methylenetetrahydrofolate reductase [Alphaproteobacteria bacterium]
MKSPKSPSVAAQILGGDAAFQLGQLRVSFEFFPPKTPAMEETLWRSIHRLAPFQPQFVSVTYGAGGSTRQRTHDTVKRIHDETPLVPAAHLTCVGATREEVDEVVRDYWNAGIRHIVALRGDPAEGQSKYTPHPGGYAYASDLVAGIRKIADFEISVAAYPEGHVDSPDLNADMDNLKRKIDAGATRAITQFFFDTDCFLRFRDRALAAGITLPLIPGIMPVTNFNGAQRMAIMNGASVPDWFARMFEGLENEAETRQLVAIVAAAEQCVRLRANGVGDFHFYTLNRADLTYALCHILGLRAVPQQESAKA